MRAIFGQNADLGHVAHVLAHAGAQDEPDQSFRLAIQGYVGRLRVEDATSREANDVIEKTQRAAERMVLVIDLSIDVSAVCRSNDSGRGLVVPIRPRTDFNIGMRTNRFRCRLSQRQSHEWARMPVEYRLQKWPRHYTGLL